MSRARPGTAFLQREARRRRRRWRRRRCGWPAWATPAPSNAHKLGRPRTSTSDRRMPATDADADASTRLGSQLTFAVLRFTCIYSQITFYFQHTCLWLHAINNMWFDSIRRNLRLCRGWKMQLNHKLTRRDRFRISNVIFIEVKKFPWKGQLSPIHWNREGHGFNKMAERVKRVFGQDCPILRATETKWPILDSESTSTFQT